jgi:hypothetical protein
VIVAFTGRRIDARDATTPRFPLTQVAVVRDQIQRLFCQEQVTSLLCSGACGADLIALRVAQDLGIHYRIVLPFAPEEFRVTSVLDRPNPKVCNWGALFDQVIETAKGKGDLVVIATGDDRQAGYQAVNHAILDMALQEGHLQTDVMMASGSRVIQNAVQAVIAWDGHSRGPRDLTRHFAEDARSRGLVVKEIFTLQKSFNEERENS